MDGPGTTEGSVRAGWVPVLHAVLFLLFIVQLLVFFGVDGEDCYITFRYARNLAEGCGLVYNPGEYVEGISNPYWALCLAGLYRLGLSMTFACSLLVFVHAAAAYAVTAAASAAWFGRRSWFSLLAPLLLCAMTILPAGYQNGLEGSAAALGVALVCLGVAGDRPAVLVAGVAVLLGNRPEAPGYAVLSVLWLGWRSWMAEGRARRRGLAWAGGIAALVAGMVLVRYGYYGDIVPHTLRAKGSIPLSQNFHGGGRYLAGYARLIGPWMLPLASLAVAARGRRAGAALLLSFVLMNAAMVLRNGGDWMAHYRLLTPLFGAFALLSAAGFAWCWSARIPLFRAVLAGVFLAGVAWLPDLEVLHASMPNRLQRLDALLVTPDRGNYHVDSHVTGPLLAQEPDDLFLAENGGQLPYLLKEVRVVEMAGLTDRDLVSEDSPCMDYSLTTGVLNWHGLFVGKNPTYVQFPSPCLRSRLHRLFQCPEVLPALDPFIIAQNACQPNLGAFDVLLVRNDRRSLEQFIRDFGAFVPAADMARGIQQGPSPILESWGDITSGPHALSPWRCARTGRDLSDSWCEWIERRRYAAEMALVPGANRFSRPLTDGCALLVVVDLPPLVPEDTRLTFTRTGDGSSRTVPSAGAEFPADKYRCHYLFLPESPQGTSGELLLDADTSENCHIRVSVSRWAPGPPPALPAAHLYPDKSDCRGMIARRMLTNIALEHMTALYLEENDLDGLLREWDETDPAVFPAAQRHCARGLAFEESGRHADALREYGLVTEDVPVGWWYRVPDGVHKWLRRIPAWADSFPERGHLEMAAWGTVRSFVALGDVAGVETACLMAAGASGGDYAAYEALDALYTGRVSPGEAAQKWEAVAAAHPDHAWARYMLSLAHSRIARHEEALQEARAALALSPDNQVMRAHVLATVREVAAEHLSRGRFAEALSLWREVGGVDGKLGEAKVLAAMGDVAGAEEALLSLLLTGPASRVLDIYEGLDALYAAALPPAERPARWLEVARKVPDQPWAHIYRGCALEALSHGDKAQEAYLEAAAALVGAHMRGD